jgi:energy-coupling factor transport system ATP-binding protein
MQIEVKDLSYTYLPGSPFEEEALRGVSFDVSQGEFIGIIGHTGSGKSTLMQLIGGLLRPSVGTVRIEGRDIFEKNADRKWLRRTMGMVFQYPEHQLFEETVYQDIEFGPRMTGVPEDEIPARIKDAMELVGLDYDRYKDMSPFELSGGQKRKAAMAGVLAMRPRILLMDEPIAGLDPEGRCAFMELTCTLNKGGTTIMMISHNMDGLAEYASRILVFNEGALLMDDTPRGVFSERAVLEEAGLGLPEAAAFSAALEKRGFEMDGAIAYDDVLEKLKGALL